MAIITVKKFDESVESIVGTIMRVPHGPVSVQRVTTHYSISRKVGDDVVWFKIRKEVPEHVSVQHKDGTFTRFWVNVLVSVGEAQYLADELQYAMRCKRKETDGRNAAEWAMMSVNETEQIREV